MRYLHYLGYALNRIIMSIAAIVSDFCRLALRIDYGHAWRTSRDLGITAYRKIDDFKPEYRDSYDTHGLSLAGGRWRG
jgi:hypothetical protein